MAKTRMEDQKNKPSPAPTRKTVFENDLDKSVEKNIIHKGEKVKKRNWAFVIYPESLPEDWLDILRTSGLPIAISPLHDKDKNPDGTEKKPHYHCIAVYGSPTTFNNVKTLTDKLNAPIPIPLDQVRGMYRYLTHKDNPEKFQYDEKDIQNLNGFSILDFCELTKNEVNKIKRALLAVIREHQFTEYRAFMDFVDSNLSDNEFDVASNHTFFFDKYLTSSRHSSASAEEPASEDTSTLADQALSQ